MAVLSESGAQRRRCSAKAVFCEGGALRRRCSVMAMLCCMLCCMFLSLFVQERKPLQKRWSADRKQVSDGKRSNKV